MSIGKQIHAFLEVSEMFFRQAGGEWAMDGRLAPGAESAPHGVRTVQQRAIASEGSGDAFRFSMD